MPIRHGIVNREIEKEVLAKFGVLEGRIIALTQGLFTLIDAECYESLIEVRWRCKNIRSARYAVYRICREHQHVDIPLHRLIAQTPDGKVCHHVNDRTLDNRRGNLRNLTPSEHGRLTTHRHSPDIPKLTETWRNRHPKHEALDDRFYSINTLIQQKASLLTVWERRFFTTGYRLNNPRLCEGDETGTANHHTQL